VSNNPIPGEVFSSIVRVKPYTYFVALNYIKLKDAFHGIAVCVCVRVCVCVCMYIYIYIYTYTHHPRFSLKVALKFRNM